MSERFAGALTRLPVEVRRPVVAQLSQAGMSTRAIAPIVGKTDRQVRYDLNAGGKSFPTSEAEPVNEPATPESVFPKADKITGNDGKRTERKLMPKETPQAIKDQIVTLARGGTPRNHIAKQLGVSPATVTKWANRAGVEFDRYATQAATEARQMDLKALRIEAAVRTVKRMIQLDDQLDQVDPLQAAKLSQAIAAQGRAHADVSRLDLDTNPAAEEARDALREFITGAKERAAEIEARDAKQSNTLDPSDL